MIVLGLDPSQDRSGLARRDLHRSRVAVETRSIHAKLLAIRQKIGIMDAFSDAFETALDEWQPDFVMIEAPREDVPLFPVNGRMIPNAKSTLAVNRIYGGIRSILRRRRLPFAQAAPSTWRKQMFGFGTKKGWETPDWKREAKKMCLRDYQIIAANGDEAEAALLALYAHHTDELKLILNKLEQAA